MTPRLEVQKRFGQSLLSVTDLWRAAVEHASGPIEHVTACGCADYQSRIKERRGHFLWASLVNAPAVPSAPFCIGRCTSSARLLAHEMTGKH